MKSNYNNKLLFFTEITTVEGILSKCIAGLEQDQPVRKVMDPESAEKIEAFITVLMGLKNLERNFTIVSFKFSSIPNLDLNNTAFVD